MTFKLGHTRNRGSDNAIAVLTEADIVRLRETAAAGAKQRDIAARYGVSESLVSRVVLGKDWAHAGGPIKRTITVWEYPDGTQTPLNPVSN